MNHARGDDPASRRILAALARRNRPYLERDICSATRLSKYVVRSRCRRLREAGLIRDRWVGPNGPYWELEAP